jgi:hypothetical protein
VSYTADVLRGVSQLDEQSGDRARDSSAALPTRAADLEDDELSDAALDAVVGGLTVDAALARAAAFDAGRLSY